MLINCPRCGFSQPQDQYCARCGVDMQSFKPKAESSFFKFLKNPILHVLILFAAATYFGRQILQNREPQKWTATSSRYQGIPNNPASASKTTINETSTTSSVSNTSTDSTDNTTTASTSQSQSSAKSADSNQLADLKNKEIQVAVSNQPTANETKIDINAPVFRVTFVEISNDTLNRWMTDSASQGQYQNISDFSVGFLNEFRKRTDLNFQVLKSFDKKVQLGQIETELSGRLTEDGSQMMGLTTSIDYKSHDNNGLRGLVTLARNQRMSRENFPIEFELNKGAALYIVGFLKRNHFQNERDILSTAPFQIYKSNDFMTQKTEFVIVIEPEYK